jgi:hypothetical protein
MMIFNMATSYFHKNSFDYFEDYLMTKLTFCKVYAFFFISINAIQLITIWAFQITYSKNIILSFFGVNLRCLYKIYIRICMCVWVGDMVSLGVNLVRRNGMNMLYFHICE